MRRNTSFKRLWGFGLALLAGLFIANGTMFYVAMDRLVSIEQRVGTTQIILRAIKDVFSSVQDAEIGLHGYLISGRAEHLAPYHRASEQVELHMRSLKAARLNLSSQQQRIEQLEELVAKKLSHLTQVLKNEQRLKNGVADEGFSLFQGHEIMAGIRSQVNELVETEYRILTEQRQQATLRRRELIITIVVATGIGLALVAIVAALVNRAMRRKTEEAEYLERQVQRRTKELSHYSNELKRSNRELQDFAFVASHDLQEPLRKIRAFGDRLQNKYAQHLGEGAEYIFRMQAAALRMSRLIEDLLEFSRITTRARPFEKVDLNQVVADVIDDLQVVVEERGATISVGELPVIDADPTQMHQLFQNLVGNSLKFMELDVVPNITIEAECYEGSRGEGMRGWCRIQHRDNGIGFDAGYMERVFAPFKRLHGKGEYTGTGIGLAVCRRIVERHDGVIYARSALGEGATFIIEIPTLHYSPESHPTTDDETDSTWTMEHAIAYEARDKAVGQPYVG